MPYDGPRRAAGAQRAAGAATAACASCARPRPPMPCASVVRSALRSDPLCRCRAQERSRTLRARRTARGSSSGLCNRRRRGCGARTRSWHRGARRKSRHSCAPPRQSAWCSRSRAGAPGQTVCWCCCHIIQHNAIGADPVRPPREPGSEPRARLGRARQGGAAADLCHDAPELREARGGV